MLSRIAAALAMWTLAAGAYNPPVDTAGPLTVRIEGPATIAQTGTAVPYVVTIENTGDAPMAGKLRLAAADGWQVEPGGEVDFSAAAGASARSNFSVTAARGSYSGHYPVHAYATIGSQGHAITAHPILVVETKLPAAPAVKAPPEWKAVEAGKDSGLALWRLPVFRAVVQVFSQKPLAMSAGWQGTEESARASLQMGARIQRGDTRETIGIHPPYYQGRVGTAFVEFPLVLPKQAVKLKFANAVRDPVAERGEKPGDGVTFRVRVAAFAAPAGAAGVVVYEKHTDSKVWLDGEADLSRWAGQTIRLQLESHPGPAKNTNCDQSYWAEPTLIAGTPPARAAGNAQTIGKAGEYEVQLQPGPRGLLDASIGFAGAKQTAHFQGFPLRVLGDALEDWRSSNVLAGVGEERDGNRRRFRHRFQHFDVLGEIWADGRALRAKFWLENAPEPRPWRVAYIEDIAAGRWSEKVRRVYAGPGNVMVEPQAFRLGFDGHRLATSFVGMDFENGLSLVQAVDVPPTKYEFDPAKGVSSLRAAHSATFTFIPAANVWEAGKIWREMNGQAAAGGVAKLAGRFVFDLWGGRYGASAAALKRAAAYGLTDSVVVWHNWQRWGYDYRLPDIYPPNPQFGTQEEFLALVQAAKDGGMLFAPHDNYIDLYPDADGFTYDNVSFTPAGQPVKAWFNKGRNAQSYRWLTDRYRPYLERNVNLMRAGFAPTAFFIDVWSSIGPYDAWTRDGRLVDRVKTQTAWGNAFAWIRNQLGDDAPQISESGHDALIGWLDGAQANHLRVDTPPAGEYSWTVWNIRCADSERIPWFDLAHHDRFALHGAGYEVRYAGGLDRKTHGMYSDDYISTEVLTGHPAMAGQAFNANVVRKYWLLHDLGRALALKRIAAVEFADGNIHRQHVQWSGGGEVWVNRGADDWSVAGHALPQYGFYARIPVEGGVVEAAIEKTGGGVTEWSRSPAAIYANARSETEAAVRMRPAGQALWVTPLPDTKTGQIRVRWAELPWQLTRPRMANLRDEDGKILNYLPASFVDGELVIPVQAGVFAYELR